ncbi:hypothetical protein QF019_006233 [Pseudomonas frederiksbergensis]|uniref:ABC-three component system middle component 1 n=1 Tax=Pseudomonas frederiksbergensis TaxID=104087 RepID=UPI003D21A2F6
MLSEILRNIFLNHDLSEIPMKLNIENYMIFVFEPLPELKKQEYYVIIESMEQSEEATNFIFDELSDLLFEKIRISDNIESYFVKNCTLIICCEKSKTSNKLILSIEEDPYNFKKNIITYTKGEITSLNETINKTDSTLKLTNEQINNILNGESGNLFRSFKEKSSNINSYYSLLLKIVSKVPFATYQPAKKSLHDLDGDIEKELTKEQQILYLKALDIDLNASDKEIEDLILNL